MSVNLRKSDLPTIDVYVPCFNNSLTLESSLLSILDQTGADDEFNYRVVVSDHESTDDTVARAAKIGKKKSRNIDFLIETRPRKLGLFEHWNDCLRSSSADYFALFHADDFYAPTMLRKQINFFRNYPEADLVFTEARCINAEGNTLWDVSFPDNCFVENGSGSNSWLDFSKTFEAISSGGNGFLFCPSVLFKRESLLKLGGFSTKYPNSSDLDLWLRCFQHGMKLGVIREPLLSYRLSSGQASGHYEATRKENSDFFSVMRTALAQSGFSESDSKKFAKNLDRLELNDLYQQWLVHPGHPRNRIGIAQLLVELILSGALRHLGGGDRIRIVLGIVFFPFLLLPGVRVKIARWILKETDLRRDSFAKRMIQWIRTNQK